MALERGDALACAQVPPLHSLVFAAAGEVAVGQRTGSRDGGRSWNQSEPLFDDLRYTTGPTAVLVATDGTVHRAFEAVLEMLRAPAPCSRAAAALSGHGYGAHNCMGLGGGSWRSLLPNSASLNDRVFGKCSGNCRKWIGTCSGIC